jgi:hypothetical protein
MDNVDKIEEVELTAAEKLAQFEKEKLTRRQALARFGFQAGAAAVAALTADELLRKVGTEMRKRAGDNRVAQQVASEFQKAGTASALAIPIEPDPDAPAGCEWETVKAWCQTKRPNKTLEDCCKMVFGTSGSCRGAKNPPALALACYTQ